VRRYTDMTYCDNYSTPLTGHSLGSTATYSSTSWDFTANSGYPETAPPSGSQTYNQYNWPSRIDADSHSAVSNFGGSQQYVTETPYGAGHHQHWQSQPLWPVQQQLDNWQQYEGNRGSQMYQDLRTAAANGQQYGGYGGSQMHQYSNAAPGPAGEQRMPLRKLSYLFKQSF
jgi:hypothetical protein